MNQRVSPLQPPIEANKTESLYWRGLHGSSGALAISRCADNHPGPLLVVCHNGAEAVQLEAELNFYAPEQTIIHFGDWETLPYDNFSPHQDIISERLSALYRLPQLKKGIVICAISTLMHRLAPESFVTASSLYIKVGQQFDIDQQRKLLQEAGYLCVDTVYEHGEFAVRGSLLDIFPMGSAVPYRIDLFDDEVDSLRSFDPETQRSQDRVDRVELLAAKEFPVDAGALRQFRQRWTDEFSDSDPKSCSIYQDIAAGIAPAGIEYYLPLFFDQCASLFDYLPTNSLCLMSGPCHQASENFWRDLSERYESRKGDIQRPLLSPQRLFLSAGELFSQLKLYPRIEINPEKESPNSIEFACRQPPELPVNAKADNPLTALEAFLLQDDNRVLFSAESAGRRESLLELLGKNRLQATEVHSWREFVDGDCDLGIIVSPLDRGLVLAKENVSIICESQLFGQRVQQSRRRRKAQSEHSDFVVKNLAELNIGAPVVHIDHGVGRYRGLQTIHTDGQNDEFLMLEYANEAKLYVPVANLHLIARYNGAEESLAPLHRLGSEQWQKAKRKAAEKVRDVAAELLDIYARRAARKGFKFRDPKGAFDEFSAGFPFEETPDQVSAIQAVFSDMTQEKAMDRLVCGDVGFGKTEVAMRAAFLAVHSGKQVTMLVPTTLLAQQHYENFKDRFADWPVNIEVISRFRTGKETQAVETKLADGNVDILIGTHKILQSGLNYKALGLLIIDEEHRFGVRQKEQLKSLRSEVDILTMTATPIPRTLNMAMSGVRDLSIIATPPAKRLSVKTFVRESDEGLVKEAILRELLRGGQVYYLHNEVKTIEKVAEELSVAVPEARIAVGHGQMRERELEQVMSDFYHKRFNVLLCTTIIETGIDVPNANTIIINRADKFGLAQLHQLRGRVGRSHHQAYAYLLTPNQKSMTRDAQKRLEAIANAQDLGAGFTLATHDLEIRGAGELLGDDQSGQMHAVGFTMYMDMLDRAVKAIQRGETTNIEDPLDTQVDVNLRVPALIPDDYLPDTHSRLILYKRIASAQDSGQLRELQVEMIDRFGLLPDPIKNLFRVTELKLKATSLGIEKLEAGSQGGVVEFASKTQVDPITIVNMVQQQPQKFKLSGANQLRFSLDLDNNEIRISTIEQLLNSLGGDKPA